MTIKLFSPFSAETAQRWGITLDQTMDGLGTPFALQGSVTGIPSMVLNICCPCWMTGRTTNTHKYYRHAEHISTWHNYYNKILIFDYCFLQASRVWDLSVSSPTLTWTKKPFSSPLGQNKSLFTTEPASHRLITALCTHSFKPIAGISLTEISERFCHVILWQHFRLGLSKIINRRQQKPEFPHSVELPLN